MRYVSTRGGVPARGFSDILLGGLAADGGLAVPEHYPRVDAATLARWRGLSYVDLACEILGLYCDDIDATTLRGLVTRAYTAEAFGSDSIVPLTRLPALEAGETALHLLELSNGPTLAFKDIAMQLLGQLFEHVLSRSGRVLNILGATSGDTGSAAEYAMLGKKSVRVFMLSPHGRMSCFQQAQMYGLIEPNIVNIAVPGVFDDCQDMVKAVSADLPFKERHAIGTVNSINWARVIAQVVYYFRGYFAATVSDDQQVSFAVPTGNFGNILAGHIARSMGLPIRTLVLATNENDVLEEFFRTGRYRPRRSSETLETSSPSMDISKASNFERFVFDLCDRDSARIAALWYEVDRGRAFDLSVDGTFGRIGRHGFAAGASSHALRLQTIRAVHAASGRVIDPHTADGVAVARRFAEPGVPMICLETALPAKFETTIHEALGRVAPRPSRFDGIESRPQRFTLLPADVGLLKSMIARHALSMRPERP